MTSNKQWTCKTHNATGKNGCLPKSCKHKTGCVFNKRFVPVQIKLFQFHVKQYKGPAICRLFLCAHVQACNIRNVCNVVHTCARLVHKPTASQCCNIRYNSFVCTLCTFFLHNFFKRKKIKSLDKKLCTKCTRGDNNHSNDAITVHNLCTRVHKVGLVCTKTTKQH